MSRRGRDFLALPEFIRLLHLLEYLWIGVPKPTPARFSIVNSSFWLRAPLLAGILFLLWGMSFPAISAWGNLSSLMPTQSHPFVNLPMIVTPLLCEASPWRVWHFSYLLYVSVYLSYLLEVNTTFSSFLWLSLCLEYGRGSVASTIADVFINYNVKLT